MAQRDGLKRRRGSVARNVEHVHPDPPLVEPKDIEHIATASFAVLVAPFEILSVDLRRDFRQQRRLNGLGCDEPRLEPLVGDAKFSQLFGESLFEAQDSLSDSNLGEQPGRTERLGEECIGAGIQCFD